MLPREAIYLHTSIRLFCLHKGRKKAGKPNSHGVNKGWKLAQALVTAGLDIQGLDTISKEFLLNLLKKLQLFSKMMIPVFIANSYKIVAKTE